MNNMNYKIALEAIKAGRLVQRKGWNDKGMFVFQRPTDNIPTDIAVGKVFAIDDSSKVKVTLIQSEPYLSMKGSNGETITGWLPSQADKLAEDWIIFYIKE